ncbi:MAG: transglycosylase SLT domain-containing protein [Chitinispirillaceae bacterium]|jgi:soluble lytic murein transglycosylase-like protein/TolA-binding protein|nr:transglycosylase SLT domain-containing protein [Chitinispirillaceae bacterium]
MNRILILILPLFFLTGTAWCADAPLFRFDWTGSAAIRSGSYASAINQMNLISTSPDSAVRFFLRGTAYLRSGDTAAALPLFAAAATDLAIAPLAFETIGNIFAKTMPDSALLCYGRALDSLAPPRYRTGVFARIRTVLDTDTVRIAARPWKEQYLSWLRGRKPAVPDVRLAIIDTLISRKSWEPVDSIISQVLSSSGYGTRSALAEQIARKDVPDRVLSFRSLLSLASAAMETGTLDIAEQMLAAAQRKKVPQIYNKEFLRLEGMLAFSWQKYDEAAEKLCRFVNTYGDDSEILQLIGRAFWKMDSTRQAARWYDRYLAQYPTHGNVPATLWQRAWIEEERGRNDQAMQFYRKLFRAYPSTARAEEAMVRYAIGHYRAAQYDSAIAQLSVFRQKYPASNLGSMARYWKARCLLAAGRVAPARALLDSIAVQEPYEYYAHRARTQCALSGDSCRLSIDTTRDETRAISWLDSIDPSPGPLSRADTLNVRRGMLLAAIGSPADADLFLGPVEASSAGNLSLEFAIATLYRQTGAPVQAARSGRRLFWRIPPDKRDSIPLSVYSLMFPLYFIDSVRVHARKQNLDPMFVLAVIRQESGFDPDIRSRAGAIGLMQIMPATCRALAKELREPFSTDSLSRPFVNIRYGTYYLRKLLDQFDNSELLALASYNAGPPNAQQWQERSGKKEFDLFVEDIGFSETRGYVKKVMANYWFYKALEPILLPPGP